MKCYWIEPIEMLKRVFNKKYGLGGMVLGSILFLLNAGTLGLLRIITTYFLCKVDNEPFQLRLMRFPIFTLLSKYHANMWSAYAFVEGEDF